MNYYAITRRIAIDAGHRIIAHDSKCCNLHGHHYIIEATCAAAQLQKTGEQTDMVLDFSFLKEEMLSTIVVSCDHGFIVSLEDETLLNMLAPQNQPISSWKEALTSAIHKDGFCLTTNNKLNTRLYVVPFQTTAERLAKHWFERLAPEIVKRSNNLACLVSVAVWETPNNQAEYTILPKRI